MRIVFALISLTMGVFAQNSSVVASAQAACGPKDVSFDVQNDDTRHSILQPEVGKALVYVIQEDSPGKCVSCTETKVALDGAWVGANRHNSYVSFAVDPGERHLCVVLQGLFVGALRFASLAHLNAEAGKIYYFRTRTPGEGRPFVDLDAIDSDQGKFLIARFPASTSRPKK
jgi:hypothetical protein